MKSFVHWGLMVVLLILAVSPGGLVLGQEEIPLVPFSSETFGIQGLVPEGWAEASPGVYVRAGEGQATIIQQAVPGMSVSQLGDLLVTQLGIEALPEPSGTQDTGAFAWTLYQIELEASGQSLVIDLALAGSDTAAYVVLFQTSPEEYDNLHGTVFVPAVDAFAPLTTDAGETERYDDPDGLFSVPIPTNWTAEQADGYGVLASPDDLLLVMIVVVDADEVYAAEEAAWAVVNPDFEAEEEPDYMDLPADDLDRFTLLTYPEKDNRSIVVEVRIHAGKSYVLIFDVDNTEAQKRQAQLGIIDSGFEIVGIEQLDLTTVEPRAIDEALIADLEAYIDDTMVTLETPGVSIAIVRDGDIVYAEGFGSLGPDDDTPITPETQMMVGSTTKTLTTLLMAMLVDDGAMDWDTPVVDILPSFNVADPDISQLLTVEHLVCACSGVPRRDLEWVMNADALTAETVIESLGTFEFFTDFGGAFQYSNQMVATGGFIAALAGGGEYGNLDQAYIDLLQTRVLDPIGMPSTTFSFEVVEAGGNYAMPYGATMLLEYAPLPMDIEEVLLSIAPAGALWSNAIDMANYMIMHMNEGVTASGTRLVSVENLHYTWEPQVAISASDSYGLGWIVSDYHGLPMYSHAGNTFGFSSEFAFLPETGLGIVVQTNQRASLLNSAVVGRFLELVFDQEPAVDSGIMFTYNLMRDEIDQARTDLLEDAIVEDVEAIVGTWTNEVLGPVTITFENGTLRLDAGEFVSELRQVDPASDAASDAEGPVFVLYDPPLSGIPIVLTENEDGEPSLLYGAGVAEYIFDFVE